MLRQPGYRLLDFGGGARLERFAARTVDRPHPAALDPRRDARSWLDADLRFDRDHGWTGPAAHDPAWPIELAGLSMELRPTESGQVGLFPEHLAMIPWLRARVIERAAAVDQRGSRFPEVLNLFAYTGLATLALADAGAAVAHVDGARPAVAWARRNAERSRLGDRPTRWIVDDARTFTQREGRRGRRYAGLVMDPPSYGHGSSGPPWQIEADLGTLLAAAANVLEPGGFVLLTAHTPTLDGDRLATNLGRALGRPARDLERGELVLSTEDGRRLELGAFARWPGGAS